MISFGRKCPACGSRHVVAAADTSRPAGFPGAKRFACANCGQQLICLPGLSCTIEQRHHPRRRLPPFFLVRIPGRANRFAHIHNISEGGICFASPGDAMITADHLFLDLYNCNDGSSLERLPAEIVSNRESRREINGVNTTIITTCARFTTLNRAQKKVLDSCIVRYGTV
ncbi:MAG: PilZ domain-containing protein [Desulfobulbus sp.]|nr:PilZ domain-containing protein [Desulfobulbus sp.]